VKDINKYSLVQPLVQPLVLWCNLGANIKDKKQLHYLKNTNTSNSYSIWCNGASVFIATKKEKGS